VSSPNLQKSQDTTVTFRTGWILAGTIAFALLSGSFAYSQATDAQSTASVRAEGSAKTEATPSASSSAAADATSSASQTVEKPAPRPAGSAPRAGLAAVDWAALVRVGLYSLAQGPLLILACILFVLGVAWRVLQLGRVTRPVSGTALPARARIAASGSESADLAFLTKNMSAVRRVSWRAGRWLRRTMFASSPVMSAVSMVFHVGLFFVPFLLPGHNFLFRQKYHVGLPTLPEPVMDRLTILLLAFAAFFLLRRILFPRVRALSTAPDYLVLLMVAAPFFTGLVAYHHWMDYRTIMALHMTAADLLIAAIPFTKLGHMPFLLYARLGVSAERAWRPAQRRW
jgi:nitrate reductase gamma subunit